VAKLTDYLDRRTLQDVQKAFSTVAGHAIRICTPGGQPLFPSAKGSNASSEPARRGKSTTGSRFASRRKQGGGSAILDDVIKTTEQLFGTGDKHKAEPLEVNVELDEEIIARLHMARHAPDATSRNTAAELESFHRNLLRLMANVLTKLCSHSASMRSRVDQLLAVHRVTAAITEEHDLQRILDTVTRTVVEAMNARAATIRLLSADRQELVIRSGYNLSESYLCHGAIRLAESPVDRRAMTTGQCVYVADMTTDPRVICQDEARQEGIVSCLAASLVHKNRSLGVLRVYTGEWYEFDAFEAQLLQTLANWAAAAIVNASLFQDAVRSTEIKRQVAMAGEVQRRMIPQSSPDWPGFDIAGKYVPSAELAGDFYDYIDLPPDNLGLAICDVVGKGARASLLMASIRASLRAHATNVYSMSEVLELVNRDLCRDTLVSDFATMFYGVLNRTNHELTYASAGHMPPILIRDGQVCHLQSRGGVVGLDEQMAFPVDSFPMRPGDVVLAYTDGLSEAVNFAHEEYGPARIEQALLAAVELGYNAESIIRHLLWDQRRFTGLHRRLDDLTMVVLRCVAPPEPGDDPAQPADASA
jgi:phosphoserine phosphatase RsbU/P